MTIHTDMTLYWVEEIKARSTRTSGAPLILDFNTGGECTTSLTVFTNDQALTDRLVAAINGVFAKAEVDDAVL